MIQKLTLEFDGEGERVIVASILPLHVILIVTYVVAVSEPADFFHMQPILSYFSWKR